MTAADHGDAGPLTLLPAVDVANGQAVRLVQGAAGTETGYGDPLEAALVWQRAGARWIHLVDLDAAFGRGSNAALLAALVARLDAAAEVPGVVPEAAGRPGVVPEAAGRPAAGQPGVVPEASGRPAAGRPGVAVELSGGIRDDASLAAALATGCARVVIGTAALENPGWVRRVIAEHGERIAVGLDVRGTRLAARGWTTEGGELLDVLARLEDDGCGRYVVTDVTKDGTLAGPNLDLLRRVCARTDRPVIASGGVSSLADLRAIAELRPLGVEGAIVGKALYARAFTLEQALTTVGR